MKEFNTTHTICILSKIVLFKKNISQVIGIVIDERMKINAAHLKLSLCINFFLHLANEVLYQSFENLQLKVFSNIHNQSKAFQVTSQIRQISRMTYSFDNSGHQQSIGLNEVAKLENDWNSTTTHCSLYRC